MNSSQANLGVQDLLALPPVILGSITILELLTTMLIFAGVIIVFTRSARPGRKSMLFSLVLSAILFLVPLIFGEHFFLESSSEEGLKIYLWFLPLAGTVATCIGAWGFFRFALSIGNES